MKSEKYTSEDYARITNSRLSLLAFFSMIWNAALLFIGSYYVYVIDHLFNPIFSSPFFFLLGRGSDILGWEYNNYFEWFSYFIIILVFFVITVFLFFFSFFSWNLSTKIKRLNRAFIFSIIPNDSVKYFV